MSRFGFDKLPKATMTLNLSQTDMDALEALAIEKQLSKTAIMRQALRVYQLIDRQMKEQGVSDIYNLKLQNPLPHKINPPPSMDA